MRNGAAKGNAARGICPRGAKSNQILLSASRRKEKQRLFVQQAETKYGTKAGEGSSSPLPAFSTGEKFFSKNGLFFGRNRIE